MAGCCASRCRSRLLGSRTAGSTDGAGHGTCISSRSLLRHVLEQLQRPHLNLVVGGLGGTVHQLARLERVGDALLAFRAGTCFFSIFNRPGIVIAPGPLLLRLFSISAPAPPARRPPDSWTARWRRRCWPEVRSWRMVSWGWCFGHGSFPPCSVVGKNKVVRVVGLAIRPTDRDN